MCEARLFRRLLRLSLVALAGLAATDLPTGEKREPWDLISIGAGTRLGGIAKSVAGVFTVAVDGSADQHQPMVSSFAADGEELERLRVLGSFSYGGRIVRPVAAAKDRFAVAWTHDEANRGTDLHSSMRLFQPKEEMTAQIELPCRETPSIFPLSQPGVLVACSPASRDDPHLHSFDLAGRLVGRLHGRYLPAELEPYGEGYLGLYSDSSIASSDRNGRRLRRLALPEDFDWTDTRLATDGHSRFVLALQDWNYGLSVIFGKGAALLRGPRSRVVERIASFYAPHPFDVAMDPSGNALLAWSTCDDEPCPIWGWWFDSSGIPIGPPRLLGLGTGPVEVAAGAPKDFVAAWQGRDSVEVRQIHRALPGDEICRYAAGRFACDTAKDGGATDFSFRFGGAKPARALLADIDGDGRDDACIEREGIVRCDVLRDGGSHAQKFDYSALWAPGDSLLAGDPDGEGRDDLCLRRNDVLLCDTMHDGGGPEIVLRIPHGTGPVLLADIDSDGDDDPCAIAGAKLACDRTHDGQADIDIPAGWLPPDARPDLADLDGNGAVELCATVGQTTRCDLDRDGRADFAVRFAAPGSPILGNPDGV